MKFFKILFITNILILLVIYIIKNITYFGRSFINWKFSNYIDYMLPFESNSSMRSFYLATLFISFIYACVHMIMDADKDDDQHYNY